jgi:hypothetical protein
MLRNTEVTKIKLSSSEMGNTSLTMNNKYLVKIASSLNNGSDVRTAKLVEKKAFLGMSKDTAKDLSNTGTIGVAGGLTGMAANKILHPQAIKGEGRKAFMIGGGLGLLGDYAAIKLNNKLNRFIDKAPQ